MGTERMRSRGAPKFVRKADKQTTSIHDIYHFKLLDYIYYMIYKLLDYMILEWC